MTVQQTRSTSDFDFLSGRWDTVQRRLRRPLTGDEEWQEVRGTNESRTFLDGAISVDELRLPELGVSGMTLRLYEPGTGEWTVYWVSARDGKLGSPARGRWVDGVSRIFSDDVHDGRPVRASYEWSGVTGNEAHWQQAYSVDDGQTWETNWVADFHRTSSDPAEFTNTAGDSGSGDASRGQGGLGDFDFLVGSWAVHSRRHKEYLTGSPEWIEFDHTQQVHSLLGGRVSINENRFEAIGRTGFSVRLYEAETGEWALYGVGGASGRIDGTPQRGTFVDGVGDFFAEDVWNGTPITVRFRWSILDPDHARWEQAFSTDAGETWETNWISDFTRTSP